MRGHCFTIVLLVLAGLLPQSAEAQKPGQLLTGYRYVLVNLPQYDGGQTDIHGFGRYVVEKFREDKSWTVLNDVADPFSDPNTISETVRCRISHGRLSYAPLHSNKVTLTFRDPLGNVVTSIEEGSAWGSSATDNTKRAINKAVKNIRKERKRFDPSKVVDIFSKIDNLETIEMTEETLRAYLDDNEGMLRPLEGIWTTSEGDYRVGMMWQGTRQRLVAFILETKRALWRPGHVKAIFEPTAYDEVFTATYFMGGHSEIGATAKLSGGILSVPLEVGGTEEVVNFVKNYPGSGLSASGADPAATPTQKSTGTGFAVARNLVVTCNHVIDDAKRVEIAFENGKQVYPLDVLFRDEANDLALLRILPNDKGDYPSLTPVEVAETAGVRLAQEVYTIGFPLGELLGEAPKLTDGTVSSLSGLENDPRMLQISVPIQPGNSGGPLFDDQGRVVGVVVASLSAKYLYGSVGTLPQNVNFAVRTDYLLTLMNRIPKKGPSKLLALTSMSRVDQVEKLQSSVGQIHAYAK